jgi:lipoyl(octanoyl) transferase
MSAATPNPVIALRWLGQVPYLPTYQAMQELTAARTPEQQDEIWLCEHPATFTQGLAGQAGHILAAGDIPVVSTNRGGQVTFHGPGQVVAYPLIDLQRAGYYVKEYVYRVEEAVIRTLAHFGVTGHRVAGAPGIYVRLDDPHSHALLPQRPQKRIEGSSAPVPDFTGLGKIAALGIKVSRHCTYHGVALNVAMDLSPFERINPCGYAGLQTVDLSTIGIHTTWDEAAQVLGYQLSVRLAP